MVTLSTVMCATIKTMLMNLCHFVLKYKFTHKLYIICCTVPSKQTSVTSIQTSKTVQLELNFLVNIHTNTRRSTRQCFQGGAALKHLSTNIILTAPPKICLSNLTK